MAEPAQHEAASREDRLADLYTTLSTPPTLGKVDFEDFEAISTEYVLMKRYATKLEKRLDQALQTIEEFVPEDKRPQLPKPVSPEQKEEPAHE